MSSLWLITPKEDHAFNKSLIELISSTVPANFPRAPKYNFIPHVTITSDIDPAKTYGKSSSPQEWLDSLNIPDFKAEHNEVPIELQKIEIGEPFFQKVTLRAKKDANLLKFAGKLREQAVPTTSDAATWAEKEYLPHLSLFYGDVPKDEADEKYDDIETQLGWEFGSLFDCCGGMLCMGAKLVLVDTSKPINEWKPIAEKHMPFVVWKMARGLI